MRDKLRILAGIGPGEESKISLLLAQSVFLGIFIASFDISAYSLLLTTFDEKLMARGYIVSGLAGIILTSIFLRFRSKLHFSRLSIINLTIVTVATLFLWSVLKIYHEKWIIVLVFIMVGPLNILSLFGFWGQANKIFGDRKKLTSLADTGILAGMVLISLLISLLIFYNFRSPDLLLLSTGSTLIAVIMQGSIGKYDRSDKKEKNDEIVEKTSFLSAIKKDDFFKILGIYSALSVLTAFAVQYSFMSLTRKQYPVAEELAAFLGLFTACMMIVTEFIRRVVFPPFVRKFGIRSCLILSPVMIVFITLIAVVTGLLFGYSRSAEGYIVFFMLLVFNKLISKTIKESIEIPSFKVIYQSISNKVKTDIQSGITYSVNESGVFFSGILLSIFGFLSFMKIIHFSILLFIISIIWFSIAIQLTKRYNISLLKHREPDDRKTSSESNELSKLKNRFSGYLQFRSDYLNLISGDFKGFEANENFWYFKEICNNALLKKDMSLLPALKKISDKGSLPFEIKELSREIMSIIQKDSDAFVPDNQKALKILAGNRMPQTTEILKLLKVNSAESKRIAVNMIGKFRITDLIYFVCESVGFPGLTTDSYVVLRSFGASADDEMEKYFLNTSGNIRLSKTILRLLSESCSKKSVSFLFLRLWSNSRVLRESAARSLIICKFRPSETEKSRLENLITETINQITWNLSAQISLKKINKDELSYQINLENERLKSFLFNLLSVTYDPGFVREVTENIQGNDPEKINLAIEIMKLTMEETVREQLISFFIPVSEGSKFKRLSAFHPCETKDQRKLFVEILNRDYNLTGLFTKACVLRNIEMIEGSEMAESLTALLFSPEQLICEETANLISRTNPGLYYSVSERLPAPVKRKLDKIAEKNYNTKELLYEKMLFLAEFFQRSPDDSLLYLATELKYVKDLSGWDPGEEKYFRWNLQGNKLPKAQLLMDGESATLIRGTSEKQGDFYYLTIDSLLDYYYYFLDESSEVVRYLDQLSG